MRAPFKSGEARVETPRLILREMGMPDRAAIASMLQDACVMRAWERVFSDAEVVEWIERQREHYAACGYGYWLAIRKTDGDVVGQIGLLPEIVAGRREVGVGWMLRRERQGAGFATEGGAGCLRLAFRDLGASSVIADIRPMNAASIRVAERLGMTPEGSFDKIVGGVVMPHVVYRISSSKFLADANSFPNRSYSSPA